MAWRATPAEVKAAPRGSHRRPLIRQRVENRTTIGLVGYLQGTPVAWVSIAPRETYRDFGAPPAGPGEKIWSLACMYIHRRLRGQGYGMQLIEAARAYAKRRGATILEAYPVDPGSPSYRFMGFVPAFERLGFAKIGTAGSRRQIMRLAL